MKRMFGFLAAIVFALALAGPALAGSGEKCAAANAQACLEQMTAHHAGYGWLGIEYDRQEGAARVVKRVVPGSPAEAAGFKTGDELLTVNGVSLDADKETLKKAKAGWKPGTSVTYTLKRDGQEQKLTATLVEVPEEVMATMIGHHMLTAHAPAMAQAQQKK